MQINATKPRKGAFVITSTSSTGASTHVELLDMPRPFTKLKALNMDELADAIVAALAGP